jgi:glutamate-1-semialdehyde aminotransferase
MTSNSQRIFRRASKKIPGGVNSPVRAWKSVGGNRILINPPDNTIGRCAAILDVAGGAGKSPRLEKSAGSALIFRER